LESLVVVPVAAAGRLQPRLNSPSVVARTASGRSPAHQPDAHERYVGEYAMFLDACRRL